MTIEELAWEFAEVFDDLPAEDINTMLARNVPLETLEFFVRYAKDFSANNGIEGDTAERLPNLMTMGYLLRLLEERLLPDDDEEPLT